MAEAQIRANHANRWTKSERVDRLYVKDLEEVSDLGNPLSPHLTGPTLDRMWATRESWQGLPAQQLREKALELASDGWLDVMDVARKDAKTGFPVGWSYRWGALPTPLEKSVGEAVSELGTAYLNGTNLRHAMKDWRGANPAFEEAMASALPMLQESFEEHFPGTRRAFLEHRGLNVSLFDLGRWVVTFTAQLLEKNAGCPEQASAFEALRQAHQRAHANVFEGFVDQPARQSDWANSLVLVSIALKQQRQALGCEVALPASPVAWRQTRETSMPSPAVSVAQSPKM